MTLFIPLCAITTWQHNELRIALRSWEKFSSLHDELLIIGHKPDWLINCKHIEFQDKYNKTENIFRKMMMAANECEEFIYANDDHFLTQPLIELPYYYSSSLKDFHAGGDTFMRYVANTQRLFPDGLYFDVHTPMIVESVKMKQLKYVKDTIFKSVYCNTFSVEGVKINDCKINGHMRLPEIDAYVYNRPFISTGEAISYDLKNWLWARFPDKSRWEK